MTHAASPSADGDAGDIAAGRLTRTDLAVLAAAALAGVAARIWVLRSPLGTLDADEAIVGLMARHLAYHGDFPVFFWGQHYGGSLEAVLAAGVFRVVGSGVLALKVVPLVLAATATVLVASLGQAVVGCRAGLYGAAAFWLTTGNYLWWSTKARGFYWATLNLGLLFLLLLLRATRQPDRARTWLALGLVGGLGWWTSPHILFFALPGLGWAAFRLGRALWPPLLRWATPAAVAGALPWLVANLRSGFASFDSPQPVSYTYLQRFRVFVEDGPQVMLGLHTLGRWVVDVVAPLAYAAVVVVLAVALVTRRRTLGVLVPLVAAYPLLFGLFPTNWTIGEGRYLLYLAPVVYLVLATVAPRRLLPLLPSAVFAVAVADLRIIEHTARPLAVDVLVPNDNDDLLRALDEHDITHASADYWVAYRTTFETDEEVIVAPDIPDQIRQPSYTQAVRASEDAARIFLRGSFRETEFRAGLTDAEQCLRRVDAGAYVLYYPDDAKGGVVLRDGQTCAVVAPKLLIT